MIVERNVVNPEDPPMAKKNSIWKRFRLVYRPTPNLLKVILLVTIVLCTPALLILRTMIRNTEQEAENLRATAAWYEQENAQLRQNIAELGTEKSVRRIAAEELGLVDPEATFFQNTPSTDPE